MNNIPLIFLKYHLMGVPSALRVPLSLIVTSVIAWKSMLAYAACVLVIVSILLFIWRKWIQKIKLELQLQFDEIETARKIATEAEEARRAHELDQMKIRFFTNVSHEFRTPLSLIISPVEDLIKDDDTPEHQLQLLMIRRNGKRLLNLVNQLLDFKKIELGEVKLNLTNSDIVKFIEDTCSSFIDIAEQNRIRFLFDSEIPALNASFDKDKIERVLFNLLSNSFKFTSAGDHVSVFLGLAKSDGDVANERLLEITIMDTGIGIPKEKQEKIFGRFYQDKLPESFLNQGSGIGLYISREFIRMHNGDIDVESEAGKGSCFTIRIPLCMVTESGEPLDDIVAPTTLYDLAKQSHQEPDHIKKPVILVIDSDDDLRSYLRENLTHTFHIVDGTNGKEGWRKTLALHPDLIVSDIIMPEMNGLDLCKKIRQDSRTAHIPIIFLTTLSAEDDQLAGSAHGANDYVTKPFNLEILLSKINALLLLQETTKKNFQTHADIQIEDIERESDDHEFLANTLHCIEDNLNNPHFSVVQLSKQMLLSRVSIYKKLLRITGKTPVEYIRIVRLKRAVQLLKQSNLNIGNIAYEVGFSSPNYFSKVFKEEYGKLPSEYLNEILESKKRHLSDVG